MQYAVKYLFYMTEIDRKCNNNSYAKLICHCLALISAELDYVFWNALQTYFQLQKFKFLVCESDSMKWNNWVLTFIGEIPRIARDQHILFFQS